MINVYRFDISNEGSFMDVSWILQGLSRMDYYNEVHGFINYTISNPRNIIGDDIRCPYKRLKNI